MMTSLDPHPPPSVPAEWTWPRKIAVVIGAVAAALAVPVLATGFWAVWADHQRDPAGFITSAPEVISTSSYAVVLPSADLDGDLPTAAYMKGTVGEIRIEAAGARPIFVGVGPADRVARYLDGTAHDILDDVHLGPFVATYAPRPGTAPGTAPGEQDFWVATAQGSDPQVLTWQVQSGNYSVVMMNADGSVGPSARVAVGATLPIVHRLSVILLVVGGSLLVVGLAVVLGALLSHRRETRQQAWMSNAVGRP